MRLHVERVSVCPQAPPHPHPCSQLCFVSPSCWPGDGGLGFMPLSWLLLRTKAHLLSLCLRVGAFLVVFPPRQPEEMAHCLSRVVSCPKDPRERMCCFAFCSPPSVMSLHVSLRETVCCPSPSGSGFCSRMRGHLCPEHAFSC